MGQFLTYEDLKKEFGTDSSRMTEDLSQAAILDRGGHCLGCSSACGITALKPRFSHMPLKQENLSVRVSCNIDPYRKYPFREEGSKAEDCPSLRRYLRRQQV